MALEGLRRGIQGALGRLRGKRTIDEEELRAMVRDLRRALLAADFNVRQTKEITDRLEPVSYTHLTLPTIYSV